MTPTKQTITDPQNGNCVAACLASVLELPLDTVPNFKLDGDQMWPNVRNWLAQQNKSLITFRADGLVAATEGTVVLAGGNSPNNDGFHCVVGEIIGGQFNLLHDPAPSNKGLKGQPLQYLLVV